MYTVYSKPACPACNQAKALILAKGLSYCEIILDVGQPKQEGVEYIAREEFLTRFPTTRTVPLITRTDGPNDARCEFIGGIAELRQTLEPMAA